MSVKKSKNPKGSWSRDIRMNWPIYVMFIPAFLFFFVLCYIPMFGIVMAFENYKPFLGIFRSNWVGFDHFVALFTGDYFLPALRNTIAIALLKLTVGFISPIVFAVLLSLLRSKKYKRTVQTLSYMPNFVAAVIACALLTEFFGEGGAITLFLTWFGGENQNWLANNGPSFWIIYTFMGIWQGIGWGSIMYVASIATVNGDLYEAAALDGASRMQRLFKITLPCIKPIIITMFVMNVGLSFGQGFDSILLLYMPSTYDFADTIYTYTYRLAFGSGGANYGLSAASGLFQSVVCTILLVTTNHISKKTNDNMALF